MCIYVPHISHIVSRRFTILIESACKGASGCCYQFIFDLTRPPNPCMKCTMKLQIDHHTGNYVPYSFRQVCKFFNVPCWPCNIEDAGDEAYGYSPYPRRLECLTICWCNYKGSTFSLVILIPWVLVRSGISSLVWTLTVKPLKIPWKHKRIISRCFLFVSWSIRSFDREKLWQVWLV